LEEKKVEAMYDWQHAIQMEHIVNAYILCFIWKLGIKNNANKRSATNSLLIVDGLYG